MLRQTQRMVSVRRKMLLKTILLFLLHYTINLKGFANQFYLIIQTTTLLESVPLLFVDMLRQRLDLSVNILTNLAIRNNEITVFGEQLSLIFMFKTIQSYICINHLWYTHIKWNIQLRLRKQIYNGYK